MDTEVTSEQARSTAEAVARASYGKLVAFVASWTRDVAAAEDALSEAFLAALEDWPRHGCPLNPESWLLSVARRKAIDAIRRRQTRDAAAPQLQIVVEGLEAAAAAPELPDRRLALLFACAHPSLEKGVRAPLMLQAVLGLDAKRIASAFLTSPAAMGKRLVRAKDKIRQAGIPLRIPEREELAERLDAVLDAIYAAFGQGWADPVSPETAVHAAPAPVASTGTALTEEAIFLARVVLALLPEEPEAMGLLALMLQAEARRRARRGIDGRFVPLAEQNTAVWDAEMITEAEALLRRAAGLGRVGRYQLEAAVQSAHADRCRSGVANWGAVLQLYDALLSLSGSPVVAMNRALALAEVEGTAAALAAMEPLSASLSAYQPYWAARADLLARSGALAEADHAYEMAIGLESDESVRRFLQERRRQAAQLA